MDTEKVPGEPLFKAVNATVIGDVVVGKDVGILFGAVIRADQDRISIGNGSNIQDNAVVHTSKGYHVRIGDQVSIGHGAIVHGCTVHDRVIIGMGAIVMNGATIGEGSIIGAGSVVTEGATIPPNSVVVGVPGKVVKETTEDQRAFIVKNALTYIEVAKRYKNE
jgi:carbonic anhydrase/acetyltransferase-like protein (isoleucine patch superfamily)